MAAPEGNIPGSRKSSLGDGSDSDDASDDWNGDDSSSEEDFSLDDSDVYEAEEEHYRTQQMIHSDIDQADDSQDFENLIKACKEGKEEGFDSLLEKVNCLNARDVEENLSPLSHAVKAGHFNIVQILLKDERTDVKRWSRREPLLHLSNDADGVKMCRLLVENGCDLYVNIYYFPNSNILAGGTPLMHYLEHQENLSIDLLDCLLELTPEEGLKPQDSNRTLLMFAVENQSVEIVQRLLEKGIYATPFAETFIFEEAVKKQDTFLLKLLFDARRKYGTKDPKIYHNSDLIIALSNFQRTRAIFDEDEHYYVEEEVLIHLIDNGVDVNMPDEDGDTPLMLTMCHPVYGIDVVKKLLEAGADPSLKNQHCFSALTLALDLDCETDDDIIDALIDAGVPFDSVEFHAAILLQFSDAVKKMMASGRALPYLHRYKKNMRNRRFLEQLEYPMSKFFKKSPLTPLISAIISDDLQLVKLFISKNFLNEYDLHLPSDAKKSLFKYVESKCSAEIVDETLRIYQQPLSLRTISFVAVSSLVGFGSDREKVLGQTGLPVTLQNELMFK